jgi:hypothetical protein
MEITSLQERLIKASFSIKANFKISGKSSGNKRLWIIKFPSDSFLLLLAPLLLLLA